MVEQGEKYTIDLLAIYVYNDNSEEGKF